MKDEAAPKLPQGWSITALKDIAGLQLGKMLDKKRTAGSLLPYLRNINIRWDRIDQSDLLEMPFKAEELERYSLRQGDVLVCEGGEPGRAAVWELDESTIKFQKALHRVRLHGEIKPRWLVYRLFYDAHRGTLADYFTGTTIKHLPRAAFLDYEFSIAPLPEQHRIVEALDSYLTRLDEATATLERVQRNLERYRASVLKSAVEGRLVPTEAETARAEGREYEPASVLLERILAERRRRWEEAELAKMAAKGKTPKNDKWKAKYKEPVAPETEELPELPEGWCWATVDQIGDVSGGLTKNSKRASLPTKIPYLRVANVYANRLELDEVKTLGVTSADIQRAALQSGDLLIVEGNGSIDQIGRVALWDGSIDPCLHQNHLIKVRLPEPYLSTWSLCWLLAPPGRRAIEQVASSTSGLHTLSLSKVKQLPIPLPPSTEQIRISAETDRLTSTALATETAFEATIGRTSRLRQSILKWAFEGKLVDQDPTDEPASALLDRIRAERTKASKA